MKCFGSTFHINGPVHGPAECVDLSLTSGAADNYENMMAVIFNSACLSALERQRFWPLAALLGATVHSAVMDPRRRGVGCGVGVA